MAARVFDTYIPGAADTLVTFINSISDERIMCFAILVRPIFTPHLTSLSVVYLCMYVTAVVHSFFSMNIVQTHIFVYKLHTKITMLSQQGNYTPFIINTNKLSLIQLEYGMGSRSTYPYLTQISLSPLNKGNDFAFFVGTRETLVPGFCIERYLPTPMYIHRLDQYFLRA